MYILEINGDPPIRIEWTMVDLFKLKSAFFTEAYHSRFSTFQALLVCSIACHLFCHEGAILTGNTGIRHQVLALLTAWIEAVGPELGLRVIWNSRRHPRITRRFVAMVWRARRRYDKLRNEQNCKIHTFHSLKQINKTCWSELSCSLCSLDTWHFCIRQRCKEKITILRNVYPLRCLYN